MGTYCWMAVRNATFDIFVDGKRTLEEGTVSAVDGHRTGVCNLDSGWAVYFISGDCVDSDNVSRFVDLYGSEPKSEFVLVNMASSVMCSDFFWYVNAKLKCSVQHNGCDFGIYDLRKAGRLPNGGGPIVRESKEKQKGVTDVDYIFDIAPLLGELKTGYRAEGSECAAKPVDGWRIFED